MRLVKAYQHARRCWICFGLFNPSGSLVTKSGMLIKFQLTSRGKRHTSLSTMLMHKCFIADAEGYAAEAQGPL